jgi:hypothetical protein|tara:strand:- start:4544 stop:4984 length:441 start_codon:yes stop_codon:yes gene_type:complete
VIYTERQLAYLEAMEIDFWSSLNQSSGVSEALSQSDDEFIEPKQVTSASELVGESLSSKVVTKEQDIEWASSVLARCGVNLEAITHPVYIGWNDNASGIEGARKLRYRSIEPIWVTYGLDDIRNRPHLKRLLWLDLLSLVRQDEKS